MTTVGVFGSTGSIGTQTLEVIAESDYNYDVAVLAASGHKMDLLLEQIGEFSPQTVALSDETKIKECKDRIGSSVEVVSTEALSELAGIADVSVNGVVGFAGLPVTLGCLQAGKRLALANKESLIAAGPVVQKARCTPGAELIPVDSEHAAIHQCLRANTVDSRVSRLQVTASGGPFRGYSRDQLEAVTVADALDHPTWSMGPKITIDSSTLMNKGLEVIEAYELYGTPAGTLGYGLGLEDIEVVVHPQSVVHSMVTYCDGSTIAKLSMPDMKLPIGYALAYPDRLTQPYGSIDWSQTMRLDFEAPDRELFPCLTLAYEAAAVGGVAPTWLSAANEVAVEAFLSEKIAWIEIPTLVEKVITSCEPLDATSLEEVLAADAEARRVAARLVRDWK